MNLYKTTQFVLHHFQNLHRKSLTHLFALHRNFPREPISSLSFSFSFSISIVGIQIQYGFCFVGCLNGCFEDEEDEDEDEEHIEPGPGKKGMGFFLYGD